MYSRTIAILSMSNGTHISNSDCYYNQSVEGSVLCQLSICSSLHITPSISIQIRLYSPGCSQCGIYRQSKQFLLIAGENIQTWNCSKLLFPLHNYQHVYRTCMANSAENESFYKVPKYLINTRPHCPKLMKFTCYTHAQSCNTESCIATIAIQLPIVD